MQRPILRGAAANSGLIFHVFAQDSTSITGAGKASVAFGSWTCYYIRSGEAISGAITPQDITTIGTYAAPTANTNIRIKAVDNTNMIGVYELQLHLDWVNTTNACQSITIYLTASGVAVLPVQIPLVADSPQIAKPTNFNLIVIDSDGRLDISKIAGTTQTARDIGASVLLASGTGTGQLDFTSGVVKSNATQFAGQTITAASGVTVPGAIASTTNITAATITTVSGNVNGSVGSVATDVGITQAAADKVFGASGAAMAELGAVPSATPNPRAALMLPFMALRNKLTVTATGKAIFNDAGSAIASKVLSDDGSTYTEDEMS